MQPGRYVWLPNPPRQITTITVYFLVQTTDFDGFAYIIESGRGWKGTIGEGRILIRLQDGITDDHIEGSRPLDDLMTNEKGMLLYDFKNLEPTMKNNVLLKYQQNTQDFDLEKVLAATPSLYATLDRENTAIVNADDFEELDKDGLKKPFTVYDAIATAVILIIGIIAGLIIWMIVALCNYSYKQSKKRKTSIAKIDMQKLLIKLCFPVLLCLWLNTQSVLGNAAMPGLWDAGTGHTFMPFNLTDTAHMGKIVMQKELVVVHLYAGYAVVKGEYQMYNTSNESVTITTGYPKNGKMPSPGVPYITFDSLYHLNIQINHKSADWKYSQYDSASHRGEEWYTWQTTYSPKQVTTLTVYFIVDTSQSVMSGGYNREDNCAFAYILESGRAWGNTIGEGRVLIRLQPPLEESDLIGLFPDTFLSDGEGTLVYDFKNLEPTPENNIVMRYEEAPGDFNIQSVLGNTTALYRKVDSENGGVSITEDFLPLHKDDFEPFPGTTLFFAGFLIFVLLLIAGIVVLIGWFIYKKIKNSAASLPSAK